MALIGFLILPVARGRCVAARGQRDGATRHRVLFSGDHRIRVGLVVLANLGTPWVGIEFSSGAIDIACTLIGLVIAAVILCFGVKYKNVLACVLAVVQVVGSLVFDVFVAHGMEVQYGLYLDSLTLVTTFIIGVVGSGICIYALGYMEDFQAHEPAGAKDRRPGSSPSCSCSCPPCTSSCSPTTCCGCSPAGRSPRCARFAHRLHQNA